ncbi:MAG: endonuclease/exonuclease/phosphatase family protein [Pirellulales bacterium]|nr:endonuclease/exonuclease/phosphatase family protein [Pirellulales bacterium]
MKRVDPPRDSARRAATSAPPAPGVSERMTAAALLPHPSSGGRWRRAWRPALVAVLALATIYWLGSQKRPTGAAAGSSLLRSVAADSPSADRGDPTRRFRIATFNIHGARGADGTRDIERTARQLAGYDLVGLNEAHGGSLLVRGDQAEQLGARLGQAWLFAPTERRWGRDDFGNGLLCRRADVPWQRIPLANPSSRSHRNFIWARLPVGKQTVNVLVTHLERGDTAERHLQLHSLAELFLAFAGPVVLMGDLNSTADDRELQQLLAAPGVYDALAEKQIQSPSRIDWILVRGLNVRDAGLVDQGASDHPLAWAELELADN